MNTIARDLSYFSFLKYISLKQLDLSSLESFRFRLLDKEHNAKNVGESGRDWLKSILSRDVIEDIQKFARSNRKVLLIRGISISTDVPSPRTGFLQKKQCVLDFDLLLFGVLELLGIQPYSVEHENCGKLVRNVVPVPEAMGGTSSWGADIDFSWHTDNPNWPFTDGLDCINTCIPNYLAFTAVRNIEKTSTDIVFVDNLLEELPNWVIEQLCRPVYKFMAPASNESFRGQARIFPILEYAGCGYRMRFDEGIVSATDPDSKEALDYLSKCLRDIQGMEFVLEPGDFFILKNTQVLHRRKAFEPHSEDKARWLRRIYGG